MSSKKGWADISVAADNWARVTQELHQKMKLLVAAKKGGLHRVSTSHVAVAVLILDRLENFNADAKADPPPVVLPGMSRKALLARYWGAFSLDLIETDGADSYESDICQLLIDIQFGLIAEGARRKGLTVSGSGAPFAESDAFFSLGLLVRRIELDAKPREAATLDQSDPMARILEGARRGGHMSAQIRRERAPDWQAYRIAFDGENERRKAAGERTMSMTEWAIFQKQKRKDLAAKAVSSIKRELTRHSPRKRG